MTKSLAVILSCPLTSILDKGEVTERYYNPGEVFDDVHIILCNDDMPDPIKVQTMIGKARLHLHNLPVPPRFFWRSLGWQNRFMKSWLDQAKALAAELDISLIRCHGPYINATVAQAFRKVTGAPVTISLHHRPDAPPKGLGFADKLRWRALEALNARELKAADVVFAVYRSQLSYLNNLGVKNIKLAYNVLNPIDIPKKTDYDINGKVKIISVGRLTLGKNPENLIRAVAANESAILDIIGDGELRPQLEQIVQSLRADERIRFISNMSNDDICNTLASYDIFAAHNDYPGVPKAVVEPMLAAVPVLLNQPPDEDIPEITSDVCLMVENSPEGYGLGISKLVADQQFRKTLANQGHEMASELWSPHHAEAKYARIYREYHV